MNGQKMSYNERKQRVSNFLKRVDPYKKQEPLNFDMRAYAAYVKEHNLSAGEISPEIMEKFVL